MLQKVKVKENYQNTKHYYLPMSMYLDLQIAALKKRSICITTCEYRGCSTARKSQFTLQQILSFEEKVNSPPLSAADV